MKILDTDVCIEILRGNARVIECRRQTIDEVATTWITACELYYGASKSAAPSRNQSRVTEFIATLPILSLDLRAAENFGRFKTYLERTGQILADADLLIAAITLAHHASLVTGNQKHYARIPELRIEDWIRGAAS